MSAARTLTEQYLTADEVAAMLRCSRRSVTNYATRGEIPHVRIGRLIRFRLSDVEALGQRRLRVVR